MIALAYLSQEDVERLAADRTPATRAATMLRVGEVLASGVVGLEERLIAYAIIDRVHGNKPGDIADARFPTPPDRKPVEVCVVNGRANDNSCSQTLVEWLKPDEMPKTAATLPAAGSSLKSSRTNAIVAPGESGLLAAASASRQIHLSISTPSRNSQIWRNPEQPAAYDRLPLKADVEPHVPQIVWYVDGQPFAVTDPDRTVFWPIQSGEHRFQIRLPYRDETSAVVPVYVQ